MATALKTPIYEDQLTAWHNQRLWYLLCGSGGVIAVLSIVLCVVSLRPHNAPYVVEVNGRGEPTGIIQPFAGDGPVADNVIRYSLGEYVRQAFSVSRSFDENRMNLSRAYALSTGQAYAALTAYYRGNHEANNPLMVSNKYWQDVRVIRTLRLPAENTYQVDFQTDRHDNDHPLNGVQTNWRAIVRMVQGKPTDKNALGLWVTDSDFQAEAK